MPLGRRAVLRRCLDCNAPLATVARARPCATAVPPYVLETQDAVLALPALRARSTGRRRIATRMHDELAALGLAEGTA